MNLIDVDELKKKEVYIPCGMGQGLLFHGVTAATIDAMPIVPAKPIGRCKDCANKEKATVNAKGFLVCPASGMEITDNDFCSYFEPKGGEENG